MLPFLHAVARCQLLLLLHTTAHVRSCCCTLWLLLLLTCIAAAIVASRCRMLQLSRCCTHSAAACCSSFLCCCTLPRSSLTSRALLRQVQINPHKNEWREGNKREAAFGRRDHPYGLLRWLLVMLEASGVFVVPRALGDPPRTDFRIRDEFLDDHVLVETRDNGFTRTAWSEWTMTKEIKAMAEYAGLPTDDISVQSLRKGTVMQMLIDMMEKRGHVDVFSANLDLADKCGWRGGHFPRACLPPRPPPPTSGLS
eukprot:jgi/Mesen1/4939/ME000247S04221